MAGHSPNKCCRTETKCREKIQGNRETDMKRRIVIMLCEAVGIGLARDAGGADAFRG